MDGKTLDKAIAAVPQEDLSRCMAYFLMRMGVGSGINFSISYQWHRVLK